MSKTINYIALIFFVLVSAISATAQEIEDEVSAIQAGGSRAMFSGERVDLQKVQHAFDDAAPQSNTLIAKFNPGKTVRIAVREYMVTGIFLPEKIIDFVLGDSSNFTWTPSEDSRWGHLSVENPGADTNLLLIGESGNIYSFYVRSIGVDSDQLPHLIVRITNDKLAAVAAIKIVTQGKNVKRSGTKPAKGEYLRRLKEINPADISTGYYMDSGNSELMPQLIFDDGVFTYFQYAEDNMDKVRRLPAVYRVIDGYDNPVNTRIRGGTLIAETVSDKWTLRHGTSHACVLKETD